jgi:hypothetical protein
VTSPLNDILVPWGKKHSNELIRFSRDKERANKIEQTSIPLFLPFNGQYTWSIQTCI